MGAEDPAALLAVFFAAFFAGAFDLFLAGVGAAGFFGEVFGLAGFFTERERAADAGALRAIESSLRCERRANDRRERAQSTLVAGALSRPIRPRQEVPAMHPHTRPRRIATAGGVYFLLLFAAGWILGPLRELALIPALGRIAGHALEAALMLALMIPAALWVIRRWKLASPGARLAAGLVALALLLACEALMWPLVRGRPLSEYAAHFLEPVGLISAALFLVFAAMPLLVGAFAARGTTKNAPEGRGV
jgi:hypothetical protein